VRKPVLLDRVFKLGDNMGLADYLIEILRPPREGKNRIRHAERSFVVRLQWIKEIIFKNGLSTRSLYQKQAKKVENFRLKNIALAGLMPTRAIEPTA
jgi:hypothetical protein